MKVFRLHFHDGENPLDVEFEDVVGVENPNFDGLISVEVKVTRGNNIHYVPERVELLERDEDCDVDLH